MPRDLSLPRSPMSPRDTGALSTGNGLSSRVAMFDRGSAGRSVLASGVASPSGMSDSERAAISARISAGAGAALGCTVGPWAAGCSNNQASVSPGAPAVLTGTSDPLDTLSDVFRSMFGPDDINRANERQQALVPVTTGGGGGSLIWILLLAGVGAAVYFYYRKRSAG